MPIDLHRFIYHDKRGERANVLPRLNRSALAREVGVSRSQLSRILSGKIEPPVKTLRRLAEVLSASLDEVDKFLKSLRGKAEGRESSKSSKSVVNVRIESQRRK